VTPRVAAPLRRTQDSSFGRWRGDGVLAPVEERAFWNYFTARGLVGVDEPTDPLKVLANDERHLLLEQRVLSKAASGGGFLVPTDLADRVISAARAAGALSRVAAEFVTEAGELVNVPLAGGETRTAARAGRRSVTAGEGKADASAFLQAKLAEVEALRRGEVTAVSHRPQTVDALLDAFLGRHGATVDPATKRKLERQLKHARAAFGDRHRTRLTGSSRGLAADTLPWLEA
jgi:hypothetical protein